MTRDYQIKDLKKHKHRHENNGFKLSIIIYRHERSEIERHSWSATDHGISENDIISDY